MAAKGGNGAADRVTIGVCVMEKKVFCSPMEQILERLRAFGELEVRVIPLSHARIPPSLSPRHQFAKKSGNECTAIEASQPATEMSGRRRIACDIMIFFCSFSKYLIARHP